MSFHIIYHHKSKNGYNACYWLEWLIEFDAISKKNKTPLIAESRTWPAVDNKYQKDSIWIIWDIIRKRAREKNNATIIKIIDALSEMFLFKIYIFYKKRSENILFIMQFLY